MIWLPATQAQHCAAFCDADSAARWLAGQPQANAVAMLTGLLAQIEAFNSCRVPPGERFASLEVLRQAVFAVNGDSQRRYEHRALPLLPAEQLAFDQTRRLWRACTQAYRHCLSACLDNDPALADQRALVAHRVLSCLRQEQLSCYLAGAELEADFWAIVHSVWVAAETLGVTRQPVADRLPGETLESTVSGQYAMALLLNLARPYALSRAQFAATIRWLSRWRELARVQSSSERPPESFALALDLSSASPSHDPQRAAGIARWLVFDRVLRKMRERLRALVNGESPENLKLGSGLSPAECTALLNVLGDRLTRPGAGESAHEGESIVLAVGLESAYHLLGGVPLKDEVTTPTSSFASQLVVDQLAVFGHVVRDTEASGDHTAELWRMVSRDADELQLLRPAAGGARLLLRSLRAIRLPPDGRLLLATVSSRCARRDGRLSICASLLAGQPEPLLAETHEKPSGKLVRHPAVLLATGRGLPDHATPQVFLPLGVPARAQAIHFFDRRGEPLPDLVLADCVAYGGDEERWSVAR